MDLQSEQNQLGWRRESMLHLYGYLKVEEAVTNDDTCFIRCSLGSIFSPLPVTNLKKGRELSFTLLVIGTRVILPPPPPNLSLPQK